MCLEAFTSHRLDEETKSLVLVWTLQPKLNFKSTQVSGFWIQHVAARYAYRGLVGAAQTEGGEGERGDAGGE